MTGRDLILYILENHLEDEPVIKNGEIIGFMNLMRAAEKFDVGTSTVHTWLCLGTLDGYVLDSNILIPMNAKKPGNLI